MTLLAVTPIIGVAIARASGGKVDPIDDTDNSWNLGTFVVLPPIALALRALIDHPLLDGWRLLAIGAGFGIVCGLLYLWARPPKTKPTKIWEVMFGWIAAIAYGWALAAMLNGLLPQALPQRFDVQVLGQRIGGGKSKSYYVRLPPLGPVRASEDWDVGRRVYNQLKIGSHVCVFIYEGALGEPWYDAQPCETGNQGGDS